MENFQKNGKFSKKIEFFKKMEIFQKIEIFKKKKSKIFQKKSKIFKKKNENFHSKKIENCLSGTPSRQVSVSFWTIISHISPTYVKMPQYCCNNIIAITFFSLNEHDQLMCTTKV